MRPLKFGDLRCLSFSNSVEPPYRENFNKYILSELIFLTLIKKVSVLTFKNIFFNRKYLLKKLFIKYKKN